MGLKSTRRNTKRNLQQDIIVIKSLKTKNNEKKILKTVERINTLPVKEDQFK